ncbi:hypothetical protein PUN28_017558 [Cardiocondyla obscurior]|uniref:Uncharacterized protein n=1 Tax=Cardiocondyla obscurior TaxID=286306 RepID=A0AAW2EKR8_9HYME
MQNGGNTKIFSVMIMRIKCQPDDIIGKTFVNSDRIKKIGKAVAYLNISFRRHCSLVRNKLFLFNKYYTDFTKSCSRHSVHHNLIHIYIEFNINFSTCELKNKKSNFRTKSLIFRLFIRIIKSPCAVDSELKTKECVSNSSLKKPAPCNVVFCLIFHACEHLPRNINDKRRQKYERCALMLLNKYVK